MRNKRLLISIIAIAVLSVTFQQCVCRKESKTTEQAEVVGTAGSSSELRNEVLIQFGEEVNMDAFIETFLDSGLEMIKPLNPSQTIWLAGFDTLQIRPETMLEILRENKDVQTVEFNKQTGMRR